MYMLKNVSRRRKIISLDHPTFRTREYGLRRMQMNSRVHDSKTGKVGIVEVSRACSGTVTLLAGETVGPYPDQILSVPDVRQAMRDGDIIAIKVEAAEAAPTVVPAKPAKPAKQAKSE